MEANSLDDLCSRWHNAEGCESSTVDDGLTIHEHLVLAIAAVDHVDINPQVTSELRRHTGGVQARQSVRAITNDNPGHRHAAGGKCLSRKSWISEGIGPSISATFARMSWPITASSIEVGALPPLGGVAIRIRKLRVSCQEREELLHATGAEDDGNASPCLASNSCWASGQHALQ
jgi:hypothetical protein